MVNKEKEREDCTEKGGGGKLLLCLYFVLPCCSLLWLEVQGLLHFLLWHIMIYKTLTD